MASLKARAFWRWSTACRPAPALPATTTAWPRPLRPICCASTPRAIRCSKSASARHRRPQYVPLTLELTADERQLIISGPNTGGKTVTLKTTALLAMMAQAGLPVPAAAASFPVFTAFLADIGDAQSIEAALSTFSAHITNLDRLSRLADARSLVLLDELGSSTDPEEGSALAVAIASHFLTAGAWSLISTHHTSLKVYAANTPGVLNAAAGVDEVTLAPNYQLRLGVPGASAGIQTAERLG
jgi:DNA mismatch repair protein MutS2